MDTTTIKEWTIPEGNVTQITDASGRVIWSAKPKTVDVYISQNSVGVGTLGFNSTMANVTINGQTYDGSETVHLTVPVGTEIVCFSKDGISSLNNVPLNDDLNEVLTYTHIAQKDTTVLVGTRTFLYTPSGSFRIIDEAPVVFAIDFGMAFLSWCNTNTKWVDLHEGSLWGVSQVDTSSGFVYVIGELDDKTYKLQLNGVDVKSTDTIEHLATYQGVTAS